MKLRDRMHYDGSVMSALISRLDPLIAGENDERGAFLLGLLGEIATKYSAHRVLTTGSVHGAADAVNTLISTSDPTTLAGAITMVNDIHAKFSAHIIRVASATHGIADVRNTPALPKVPLNATWEQARNLANHLRSQYEAHRVLTTGAVHGAADNTNSVVDTVDSTQFVPTLDVEV